MGKVGRRQRSEFEIDFNHMTCLEIFIEIVIPLLAPAFGVLSAGFLGWYFYKKQKNHEVHHQVITDMFLSTVVISDAIEKYKTDLYIKKQTLIPPPVFPDYSDQDWDRATHVIGSKKNKSKRLSGLYILDVKTNEIIQEYLESIEELIKKKELNSQRFSKAEEIVTETLRSKKRSLGIKDM